MDFKRPGIGPDAPIETNELGGKQSKSPYRFDLIDAPAIFDLAERLAYGAERYEDENWRKIPEKDHLNHALVHIFAHLGGDKQDKHLEAAFCRLMMALALIHQGGPIEGIIYGEEYEKWLKQWRGGRRTTSTRNDCKGGIMFNTLDQIIYDQKNEIGTLKELVIELQHELVEKNKKIGDLTTELRMTYGVGRKKEE